MVYRKHLKVTGDLHRAKRVARIQRPLSSLKLKYSSESERQTQIYLIRRKIPGISKPLPKPKQEVERIKMKSVKPPFVFQLYVGLWMNQFKDGMVKKGIMV